MLKWSLPALVVLSLSYTDDSVATSQTQAAPAHNGSVLMRWQWTSAQGRTYDLHLKASAHDLKRALTDKQRLDYSLEFPLQAMQGYLNPRLEQVIEKINTLSESKTPYFESVTDALSNQSDTPEATIFWQAFSQYQRDAFYHLRILPCENPHKVKGPCIRPNYSQLFYAHKGSLKDLAQQFSTPAHLKNADKIHLARQWVNTIPDSPEQYQRFNLPILGLTDNALDSDERALVLAMIIAEIEPKAALKLIYPLSSLGSASPTWLAIPAHFGVEGEKVIIDDEMHILLSGPTNKLESLIETQVELISISLY